MKEAFIDWAPRGDSALQVQRAVQIAAEFAAQGYDLTLRQLFYQFVSRGFIPNTQRSYKQLGGIIDKARLAGLLDWSYLTDRTRNLATLGHWDSPEDIIRGAAGGYAIDKWEDQPNYVEVWVEKEALAGVVGVAANALDIPYFSCRGYVSQSEMYRAGKRFLRRGRAGKKNYLIHLGDHDPSGLDMTRDITDRLRMFAGWSNAPEVRRIALNMDQVEQYRPPPNPAKVTDSRFVGYEEEFGDESWELDALDPATLDGLIRREVRGLRDEGRWADARRREATEQAQLQLVSDQWLDVVELVGTPDVELDEEEEEPDDDDV